LHPERALLKLLSIINNLIIFTTVKSHLIYQVAPSPTLASIDLGKIFQKYNTPEGWAMLGGLLFLIVLSRVAGNSKGKISTGRLAGISEKLSATNLALKQIKIVRDLHNYNRSARTQTENAGQPASSKTKKSEPSPKKPPHNRVALWCGMPRYWWNGVGKGFVAGLQTMLGASPTVWLPDAQRSMLVIGAPGSGKTFGCIDRAIESTFAQGIPTIIYDKKGDQMRLHAPLAARYGYKVFVFAPGEAFSDIFNPLDFLRDERDSVMAGELAQVINRNASSGGKTDEFFSKAGDLLAKGLLQLVKSPQAKFHDMAMVYAILRLPGLAKRLDYAVQQKQIDEWIATSFNQFLSSKDAEKTVAGILTTAAGTFSSFIQADLLPAFMGSSTIPKRIEGKQLIIFKLDDERRTAIGPLLAAAIHLCIVSNLSVPRRDPLAIFLDELPSIKLDKLPQWINEYRSNGGCFVLGIQSLNQLYETYGEKMGAAIASACSTHILFNPGDAKTAEEYSKRYGEKEIELKNRSTSSSSNSQSVSWNESLQKIPLFTVDQILRFTEGWCVITNPGYRVGKEGSVPYALKIPVPKSDETRAKECEQLWDSHVRPALLRRVPPPDPEKLTRELLLRVDRAKQLLPEPPEEGSQSPPPSAAPPRGTTPKRFSAGRSPRSNVNALDFIAPDTGQEAS
jgi:type IV secretion system protein VirD4